MRGGADGTGEGGGGAGREGAFAVKDICSGSDTDTAALTRRFTRALEQQNLKDSLTGVENSTMATRIRVGT